MEEKRFTVEETKEILKRVETRIKAEEKYGNPTERSLMYMLWKMTKEHKEDLENQRNFKTRGVS